MRSLPRFLLALPWLFPACATARVNPELEDEVQRCLDGYNATYQELSAASNEAEWASNGKEITTNAERQWRTSESVKESPASREPAGFVVARRGADAYWRRNTRRRHNAAKARPAEIACGAGFFHSL